MVTIYNDDVLVCTDCSSLCVVIEVLIHIDSTGSILVPHHSTWSLVMVIKTLKLVVSANMVKFLVSILKMRDASSIGSLQPQVACSVHLGKQVKHV